MFPLNNAFFVVVVAVDLGHLLTRWTSLCFDFFFETVLEVLIPFRLDIIHTVHRLSKTYHVFVVSFLSLEISCSYYYLSPCRPSNTETVYRSTPLFLMKT